MSVASHLNVTVEEYDARIRTFVPDYETMIGIAADTLRLVDASAPTIVDLGVGTGALAARCLEVRPDARLVGIDSDPAMLDAARARLSGHARVDFIAADFLRMALPPCDAIVACISLHHVPSPALKRDLYAACQAALRPGGLLVSADCFTARDPRLAAEQHARWIAHLERSYPPDEARRHLASWADEDTYFPLEDEMVWLREAGLDPDVVWRAGGLAVVAARRPPA